MTNQTPANESLTLVIFGASGDLSHRKLIPALFNLCRKNRLPDYHILGFSNNDCDDMQFKRHVIGAKRRGKQQAVLHRDSSIAGGGPQEGGRGL